MDKCLSLVVAIGMVAVPFAWTGDGKPGRTEFISVSLVLDKVVYNPLIESKAVLKCLVKNLGRKPVRVPLGYGDKNVQLCSGISTLYKVSPLQGTNDVASSEADDTIWIDPGKQKAIFELRLDDILLTEKTPSNQWRWDWPRRPEPPRSPIHKWRKPGFNDRASFRVNVWVDQSRFASNEVVLKLTTSDLAVEPGKRQVPVVVKGEVRPGIVKVGKPIPLSVTIVNELKDKIEFHGFGLDATDWNAETANISLVDIYRNGKAEGLFMAAPSVKPPPRVAGRSRNLIAPGRLLIIKTDASKWTIQGGWTAGRYQVTVRANQLQVDNYTTLSVLSDPFFFEIKSKDSEVPKHE